MILRSLASTVARNASRDAGGSTDAARNSSRACVRASAGSQQVPPPRCVGARPLEGLLAHPLRHIPRQMLARQRIERHRRAITCQQLGAIPVSGRGLLRRGRNVAVETWIAQIVAGGAGADRRQTGNRVDDVVVAVRRMVDLVGRAVAGRSLQAADLADQRRQVEQLDAAAVDQWQQAAGVEVGFRLGVLGVADAVAAEALDRPFLGVVVAVASTARCSFSAAC